MARKFRLLKIHSITAAPDGWYKKCSGSLSGVAPLAAWVHATFEGEGYSAFDVICPCSASDLRVFDTRPNQKELFFIEEEIVNPELVWHKSQDEEVLADIIRINKLAEQREKNKL
jgi:hypothetical protein